VFLQSVFTWVMTTTGDRIRRARLHKGMTAEELARHAGYATQSGIANLENRATGRGGYRLPKIAQALNVSLDWLLSGPDEIEMAKVPAYFNSSDVTSVVPPWEISTASYSGLTQDMWPFQRITPAQWQSLSPEIRDVLEKQIRGILVST